MSKKITKKEIKITVIEPLFDVDDIVMLKDNLLLVKIKSIHIKKHRYSYRVFYPHLFEEGELINTFEVIENDLCGKPTDYDQIIFNAYIEYRHKYEKLLERLKSPQYREKI